MSMSRFTAVALVLAIVPGLSVLQAQVTTRDQATVQQEQDGRQQADPGDRYEARKVATDSRSSSQPGPTVKEALVQKLIKANEAEIELAQMAYQKTDNQELRQLAQTIVRDHRQLNQQLQQHAGQWHSVRSEADQGDRQGRSGQERIRQADRDLNRNQFAANDQSTHSAMRQEADIVPQKLCKISEKACDNALKMTKEMLGNYDGQDFSMAFLGQQCVAHTMMLAELRAIESEGPEELKQLAGQAATKVGTHLQEAKQLAKKLEDDRRKQG